MKRGQQKGILLSIIPFLLTLVSAYGGQGGTFIGGFFIDTNMLAAAITFVVIFWVISFGTSKLHMFGSKSARVLISLILSLFSIYGLAKTGLSFEKLFKNIGLNSIVEIYFPYAITLIAIICMIVWGIGVVLMVAGAIFVVLGLVASVNPDFIYNWEFLIFFGTALFLAGLAIQKRKKGKDERKERREDKRKRRGEERREDRRDRTRRKRDLKDERRREKEKKYPKFNFPKFDKSRYETTPRETRKRTKKELQEKYDYYSKQIRLIMLKNNGIIPGYDKNSPTPGAGWERHRYIQAMKAIENLANQQGIKLDDSKWYEKKQQRQQRKQQKQYKQEENKKQKEEQERQEKQQRRQQEKSEQKEKKRQKEEQRQQERERETQEKQQRRQQEKSKQKEKKEYYEKGQEKQKKENKEKKQYDQEEINLIESWKKDMPSFIELGKRKAPNFKKAWHNLSKKYYPDMHPNHKDITTDIIQQINNIYEAYRTKK